MASDRRTKLNQVTLPHAAESHLTQKTEQHHGLNSTLPEAEWIDGFIFQILIEASSEDIAETDPQAVSIFMRAYGPVTGVATTQTPA